jgi:hypothetical protein
MHLLLLFLLGASPAVWSQSNELYSLSKEDLPIAGETHELFLGDSMISQRTGSYLPCLISKVNLEKKFAFGIGRIAIKTGDQFCQKTAGGVFETKTINTWIGAEAFAIYLELKEKGKKQRICIGSNCFKGNFTEAELASHFYKNEFLMISDDSFQQTIEYAGKSGSTLKFTYSEYKDDRARDAFSREFEIDLNDGNVGGFKGAIFEVVSADNLKIKYKVIRHFQ